VTWLLLFLQIAGETAGTHVPAAELLVPHSVSAAVTLLSAEWRLLAGQRSIADGASQAFGRFLTLWAIVDINMARSAAAEAAMTDKPELRSQSGYLKDRRWVEVFGWASLFRLVARRARSSPHTGRRSTLASGRRTALFAFVFALRGGSPGKYASRCRQRYRII
jgi:hypothetical protein